MTDEEKKAIKDCDSIFICLDDAMSEDSANDYRKSYKILKNLIEKQSKEIEELKKEYERVRTGRNWLSEHISAQIATPELFDKLVEENYISKDKIKAKIEELKKEQLENQKRLRSAIDLLWDAEIEKQSDKICENMEIRKVLQSLLRKEFSVTITKEELEKRWKV